MLGAIQFRHVDVNEPHVRVVKRRFRCGSKVRIPSTDADDEICVSGDTIRRERACSPRSLPDSEGGRFSSSLCRLAFHATNSSHALSASYGSEPVVAGLVI
jgi:hypothetical protein